MAIEISEKTETLIERALATGKFESAEHLLQYAVGRALNETGLLDDDAFAARVREALARSRDDVEAGRVHTVSRNEHADLYDDIKRRVAERYEGRTNESA